MRLIPVNIYRHCNPNICLFSFQICNSRITWDLSRIKIPHFNSLAQLTLFLIVTIVTVGCDSVTIDDQNSLNQVTPEVQAVNEKPQDLNQVTPELQVVNEESQDLDPANLNPVISVQETPEILPFSAWGEQGLMWADFDNNGNPDLLYMGHNKNPGLYKQIGGRFVDTFDESGLKFDDWVYPQQGDRHGASCADYDNDGYQDIFIGHGALVGETLGIKFDELLRGDGNFQFEDVSHSTGVLNQYGRTRAGQWVDINNDGWLDLYIGNFETPNVMYTSNKDGTFTDTTEQLNLGTIGWRSAWADFNNDGFMDVAEVNPIKLQISRSGQVFEDVTEQYLGDAAGDFGYSLAWADLDNDGDQDLLVGRLAQEGFLFRNDGDKFTKYEFSDVGLTSLKTITGIAPADVDNDGDQDIVMNTSEGMMIFKSSGKLEYELAHISARTTPILNMRSGDISIEDFDGDGLLDIATDDPEELKLYQNTTYQAGNWLRILFNGVNNNRMGFGNKVEVFTDNGTKRIFAEYNGASAGMRSTGCQPLHLGIGNATSSSIRVVWPNGQVSELDNVESNTIVTITEP